MKSFVIECDLMCFRTLGIKIRKVGDCFVSNTGASNPILNCVYHFTDNEAGIELSAQQILDEFNEQGLPHCWWTQAASESPRLKKILMASGKRFLGEFLGMALKVSEIQRGTFASDLQILKVSDLDFTTCGSVIAEAFEFGDADAKLYASLFAQAGTDGPFCHLVGCKNGKVVSTGTILCTEQGAYIYNVATTEAERGKGYGKAITRALLEITKQKNQRCVALISSVATASVYRKLGFQEICRFHIYA